MSSKHIGISVALVLSLVVLTTTIAREIDSRSRSCTTVLESQVCTWVEMDGITVVELGATIPLELIEAVPADAEMTWPPEQLATVILPAEARNALGFDHLGINWEAHGHPPSPFLTPHFDFHFYTLTQAEVQAIDCSDQSKPVSLPSGYVLPDIDIPGMGVLVGLCVPRMGMHAMAEEEIESTDPFDASLIVGYYGGEAIYVEPMVSRERLLEKSGFELPVPTIESLPVGVHYPGEFRAEYDAAERQYRLVFTGFDTD